MSQVRKPDANSLKEREAKRRQVFKPILDNPFTQVNWPFIEPDVARDILGHLRVLFAPVKVYNNGENGGKPDILSHVSIGFNDTNEILENQAKGIETKPLIRYIFVAKYDLNPPILTNHFPTLSYTASRGCGEKVKLIQLPKGAISDLSDWVNVPDTGVIGISGEIANAQGLYEILDKTVDVEVPYLKEYKAPVIDFLRTTMPVVKKNNQKKKGQDGKKQGAQEQITEEGKSGQEEVFGANSNKNKQQTNKKPDSGGNKSKKKKPQKSNQKLKSIST